MRSVIPSLLILAALSSCQSVPEDPPAFLERTESWVMTSKVTERDYQISIALPRGYGESTERYPVLYAVDANGQFGTVVESARLMQPDEQITFTFLAKVPGPEVRVRPVQMTFSYGGTSIREPAEAYERLLHDAMDGDHTLFARGDSVERAWQVIQPVLEAMPPVHLYSAGTWGPSEADALIAPDSWHIHSL